MSDSIYGIRGVSPFAATLKNRKEDRKQPGARNAPQLNPAVEQQADEQSEQPGQPAAASNRLDVTV